MKSIKTGILLMSTALFFTTGCKKESKTNEPYKCTSCVTAPEAKAAHDVSSKGIYKGIVIGSSGTIKFNLLNDGTTLTATLVIDGVTVNLSSTVNWTDAGVYVAPFTGTMNGAPVSITFSVQSNGQSPTIVSSTIPGHPNAHFTLVKESSNALIECFEGTYHSTKPEDGTFNILLSRGMHLWGGSHRKNGETSSEDMDGTITSDLKLLEDGTNYIGTLSSDEINGTFKDGENRTITVKGKRTL